jgi:hypothetical protein
MDVKDALFAFDFILTHLMDSGEHKYSEKQIKNLGWPVSTEGELKSHAFGLIKPQPNP